MSAQGAEGKPGAAVEELRRSVGPAEQRRKVTGVGQSQLAGAGVEDAEDERGHVVGAVDLNQEIVELAQDVARLPAVPGVGPERIAQLPHERSSGDSLADDVAHGQTDGPVGEGDDVVPVSADVDPGAAGEVAGRHVHARDQRQAIGQQAVLEHPGRRLLGGEHLGVLRRGGDPAGQHLGEVRGRHDRGDGRRNAA